MKVVSSYQSVVRGVSEQVPQQRHPGQHYEQVNMVSDPVHGLARRHGSITLDERLIDSVNLMTPIRVSWARNYREYSFFVAGMEYSLVYQGYERSAGDALPFCFVLNKDTGKFLNVNLVDPAALAPWVDGGVPAGRSNMEHTVKLQSVRWLPLTITAMEWVGQFFNNARRV
ncbi:hypothetical protein HFK89_04420 [Ralstonia pseudosolanacearum]|uniref:phage nozzle protein n=1 Tax=Ralstonia pseudosolanacearum TaxID=1310165 RepID=UPI0008F925B0|nr:hypothetical protein [Ralstonia pseudosolanacearum]MCK4161703.1 hypothetical protein [Ralstonia pseudosolanacearum]OIN77227.1 hypothetical protein BL248_02580 [Ralstonia solanacearum]